MCINLPVQRCPRPITSVFQREDHFQQSLVYDDCLYHSTSCPTISFTISNPIDYHVLIRNNIQIPDDCFRNVIAITQNLSFLVVFAFIGTKFYTKRAVG